MNGLPAHASVPGAPAAPTGPSLVPRPVAANERPRLGELLTRRGFITEEQLAWALTEARATGLLLGVVLLRERMIFEDELARTLSQQLSIPYMNIRHIGVNPSVARLLPAEVGEAAIAIPIRMTDNVVQVGFGDPTDPGALTAVTEHLPRISIAVAEVSEIKRAWRGLTG